MLLRQSIRKALYPSGVGGLCGESFSLRRGSFGYICSPEDGRDITLFRIDGRRSLCFERFVFIREITFEILIDAEKDSEVLVIPTAVIQKAFPGKYLHVENFIYKQAAETVFRRDVDHAADSFYEL